MSKIIYVCGRNSEALSGMKSKFQIIANRITPDNLSPHPLKYVQTGQIAYGIINKVTSVKENEGDVLLGMTFPNDDHWSKTCESYPDGSYAIFRSDQNFVEILTDVMASRTVWYYHDQEIFISSTSQRAIVMLLGDYQFNQQTIPWMLSTGHPGPSNSWDARITCIPADSSLVLDRHSWELNIKSKPVEYSPSEIPDREHEELFEAAVKETFKSLELDYSKWVLPLSGGYDSRLILAMLVLFKKGRDTLQSITWGLKHSLYVKGNDAAIARKLADHYKIPNTYYSTDISREPIEAVFNRFFVNGEGRIDHISAYLDGFSLWKELAENNVEGLIRGDVGFTSKTADNPFFVRFTQGFPLCSDFENLKNYQSFGLPKQQVPERFGQLEGESLDQWRDRMYEEFRIPTVLSALTDLKLSYVEIINPLLSRKIIYQARRLPSHLRNQKIILKKLVNKFGPPIEMASEGATAGIISLLSSLQVVEVFRKELSEESQSVIPAEFCTYILKNIKTSTNLRSNKSSFKSLLKRLLPSSFKRKLMSLRSHSTVDFNVLAFRTYTVIKLHQLLKEDAKALLLLTGHDPAGKVPLEKPLSSILPASAEEG
jgi:hypothetical protein